jgi:hypothetical protein
VSGSRDDDDSGKSHPVGCSEAAPERDKKTILRRRAFLVTSALAALGGCGKAATTGGDTEPKSVVTVPGSEGDAGGAHDVPAPSSRHDAATVEGMPAMEVPEGVSAYGKSQYERLYGSMNRTHGLLAEIENELPSCSILEADCERRFSRFAANLNGIEEELEGISPCGGESPEAREFAAHVTAHLTFLHKRRDRVEEAIAQRLRPGGEPARQRWQELVRAAARPRPCLEYACPKW